MVTVAAWCKESHGRRRRSALGGHDRAVLTLCPPAGVPLGAASQRGCCGLVLGGGECADARDETNN